MSFQGSARRSAGFHWRTETSFAFSARRRLRSKAEFEHVYEQGRRYHQELFQATVCANQFGCARLGLSIAARTVGEAVARNRVRRLVREVFRHQQDLPAVDIIVSARPRARSADSVQLRADLERLLTLIRHR